MRTKLIPILVIIVLVAIDQFTKYLAVTLLKPVGEIPIIDGFFSLTYLENRGAAFGILQGARWFLVSSTIAILVGIFLYYRSLPNKKPHSYVRMSLILITAGAIGNFIDRVLAGFVVDFLNVTFINFPVFNIADIYIVVGTIFHSVLLIFFIKD